MQKQIQRICTHWLQIWTKCKRRCKREITQNNYLIVPFIFPSNRSFVAVSRLQSHPELFFRFEIITAVGSKPHFAFGSSRCSSLTNNTFVMVFFAFWSNTHTDAQIITQMTIRTMSEECRQSVLCKQLCCCCLMALIVTCMRKTFHRLIMWLEVSVKF